MSVPEFHVQVIGDLSQDQLSIFKRKVFAHFEENNQTCHAVIDQLHAQGNDIAEIYRQSLTGHMLIVYGLPHSFPALGTLSKRLFGPSQNEQGQTDYIKPIYFFARNEEEKKHYARYKAFLHDLFVWNKTQVLDFPEANMLLDNVKIISSFDELSLPNDQQTKQLLSTIQSIPDRLLELNTLQKQDFNNDFKETAVAVNFADDIKPVEKPAIAVISLASPLKATNQEEIDGFLYRFGKKLAKHNMTQIFGGASKPSLMNTIARGTWENGGDVIGVISADEYARFERLGTQDKEKWALANLNSIYITSHIASRTNALLSHADMLFVAPGGTGTMDELFLFLTKPALQEKPVVLLNVDHHLDYLENYLMYLKENDLLKTNFHVVHHSRELDELFYLGFVIPYELRKPCGLHIPLRESFFSYRFDDKDATTVVNHNYTAPST